MTDERDRFFMGFALAEAREASAADEIPVGVVVVFDGQVVGRGHNRPRGSHDPTAHAEVLALREAGRRLGNYRLGGATLYATIEPCAMCAGALVHARIRRLVYGAADPRAGGVASVFQICTSSSLNHRVEITAGVLEDSCRELLRTFFRGRRQASAERCESG